MPYRLEVAGRFEQKRPLQELLYAPVAEDVSYRQSRVYEVNCSGDPAAAENFLRTVLVDEIGQIASSDSAPLFEGSRAIVDIGLKRGVLDLERECVKDHYKNSAPAGFVISDLKIFQRIYIFGQVLEQRLPELLRGVVNPAVQEWSLCHV